MPKFEIKFSFSRLMNKQTGVYPDNGIIFSTEKMSQQAMKINEETNSYGLPRWGSGKEFICQCRRSRRRGFDLWIGKISLEEEMAAHSSILAWGIPWSLEGYSQRGLEELDMTEHMRLNSYC